MSQPMSLVLGTAQWGDPYGLTNERGRLTDVDIEESVRTAKECVIADVDTARGYGDSEERLRPYAREFSVTTKVRGGSDVVKQIQDSLDRLGLESVTSVLIHDWEDLAASDRAVTVAGLRTSLDSGLSDRVGVSIYTELGVESAVVDFSAGGVELGALQVPANALDRRLDGSVLLEELAAAGAQITVRSAFLQGVLLADSSRWSDHADVREFHAYVEERGVSRLTACLSHMRALSWATHVVVGVTSVRELRQVCSVWHNSSAILLPRTLASDDQNLVDPRTW